MNATKILNKLIQKEDLTSEETQNLLNEIVKGVLMPSQIGAILTALRMKGETALEIVGFIQGMRSHMVRINAPDAIDVCGTGGDGTGTFNISTTVSFVVSGAGVEIAKHGNRAASSKCGAADVLEELGVQINLTPQQAEKVYKKVGLVFLFAPLYHPATKNVVAVRKELKIRTVFNFLGPFANPASGDRQLIGVPNLEIARKLAEVGKILGYKHLFIVTGKDGMDEVSLSANTDVLEVKDGVIKKFIIDPEKFGFKKSNIEKIVGSSAKQNALIIRSILQGDKGAPRDIVILNSAAALYVSGRVLNIRDGIKLAQASIDSGSAKKVLENLIKETQKYGK